MIQALKLMMIIKWAHLSHNDKTGQTALDIAAHYGYAGMVQLLLDRGALMEHTDMNGVRPLDKAVRCANRETVNCFLKKGASSDLHNFTNLQGIGSVIDCLFAKWVIISIISSVVTSVNSFSCSAISMLLVGFSIIVEFRLALIILILCMRGCWHHIYK